MRITIRSRAALGAALFMGSFLVACEMVLDFDRTPIQYEEPFESDSGNDSGDDGGEDGATADAGGDARPPVTPDASDSGGHVDADTSDAQDE